MIEAEAFLEPALDAGFDFYTGVPCSFLTPIINRVISGPAYGYVAAASEGDAGSSASRKAVPRGPRPNSPNA